MHTMYKEEKNGAIYLYRSAAAKSCVGDVAASRNYDTTREGYDVSSYYYIIKEKEALDGWMSYYYFD